jgi:hypothetical protein
MSDEIKILCVDDERNILNAFRRLHETLSQGVVLTLIPEV